jgi:hypothetical protein
MFDQTLIDRRLLKQITILLHSGKHDRKRQTCEELEVDRRIILKLILKVCELVWILVVQDKIQWGNLLNT